MPLPLAPTLGVDPATADFPFKLITPGVVLEIPEPDVPDPDAPELSAPFSVPDVPFDVPPTVLPLLGVEVFELLADVLESNGEPVPVVFVSVLVPVDVEFDVFVVGEPPPIEEFVEEFVVEFEVVELPSEDDVFVVFAPFHPLVAFAVVFDVELPVEPNELDAELELLPVEVVFDDDWEDDEFVFVADAPVVFDEEPLVELYPLDSPLDELPLEELKIDALATVSLGDHTGSFVGVRETGDVVVEFFGDVLLLLSFVTLLTVLFVVFVFPPVEVLLMTCDEAIGWATKSNTLSTMATAATAE